MSKHLVTIPELAEQSWTQGTLEVCEIPITANVPSAGGAGSSDAYEEHVDATLASSGGSDAPEDWEEEMMHHLAILNLTTAPPGLEAEVGSRQGYPRGSQNDTPTGQAPTINYSEVLADNRDLRKRRQ